MKRSATMAVDSDVLSHYERMRQCVLDGVRGAGAARSGTALLMRAGMAAWLLAQQAAEQRPASRALTHPPPPGPSDTELVWVLAGMVLNTYWRQGHGS